MSDIPNKNTSENDKKYVTTEKTIVFDVLQQQN